MLGCDPSEPPCDAAITIAGHHQFLEEKTGRKSADEWLINRLRSMAPPPMPDDQYLRAELERSREAHRQTGIALWAVVKAAGGQVRVPRRVLESFTPGVQLARWEDAETDTIVFGTND